jgi:CRISPR-associated protein Cas5d
MRQHPYSVSLEIAGPAAMFTRPDSGSTPISYPAPTYSAAKGMFEAVARRRGAYVRPTRIEICTPIRYARYVTNYGGPLRKPDQITGNNNYQLVATVLVDVCYRICGVVEPVDEPGVRGNPAHALQEIFARRLENGQWFYTPCLGWKEFAPSYFGPLRDGTEPDRNVNVIIPSLLHSVWDRPANGKRRPFFRQNVEVWEGVMSFDPEDARAD